MGATAINLGAIVGAGIYAVLGIVAGVAGSALLLSIGIAALVALFTAPSFSEVAACIPRVRLVDQGSSKIAPVVSAPAHVSPGEVGADTGRLTEVRLDKFSASQHSISEVRLGEIHARKVGLVEFSPGKIRLDKGCSSKVSLFEVRSARSAA